MDEKKLNIREVYDNLNASGLVKGDATYKESPWQELWVYIKDNIATKHVIMVDEETNQYVMTDPKGQEHRTHDYNDIEAFVKRKKGAFNMILVGK